MVQLTGDLPPHQWTPERVWTEVITRLKTIGRDGGLLIDPTHNIQLDTPLAKFLGHARNHPANHL